MENCVIVNVHLAKRGAKLGNQRQDPGLGFLAQMATLAGIKRDFSRAHHRKPPILSPLVEIAPLALPQQPFPHQAHNSIKHRFPFSRRIAPDKFEKRMQVERIPFQLIKQLQNPSCNRVVHFYAPCETNRSCPTNDSCQGTASAVPKSVEYSGVLTPEIGSTDVLPVHDMRSKA